MKHARKIVAAAVVLYLVVSLVLSCCISFGLARREIILHRAPFLLVDVARSTVEAIRDDGIAEGADQHGEYIAFTPNEKPGDNILTVFVWNPLSNWCDDIAARFDVAVWR